MLQEVRFVFPHVNPPSLYVSSKPSTQKVEVAWFTGTKVCLLLK